MDMFDGKLCNLFEYLPCRHTEFSEDQLFSSLLIPIPKDRESVQWSVEDGLWLMTGVEKFNGELLPCTKCENTVNHPPCEKTTKTFTISEPPAILILQLGRFREVKGRLEKINCDVKYENVLEIDVFNHKTQKPSRVKYALYSVVLHYGSLESGHYYSYVKSQANAQWFCCSDRYVRKIQDPYGNGFSEAYLLFYERLSN